ncbi:MAG: hypothetical protein AAFQ98_09495 [Bacteroidota bacterium]
MSNSNHRIHPADISWRWLVLIILLIPFMSRGQVSTLAQNKRAMVKIFSAFGTCNGTLLNTTRDDDRQLVLSARHCFPENTGRLSFLFNQDYLVSSLEIERSVWETSDYLVLTESKDLDFILFEITEPIPDFVTPYYAGWNAQAALPLTSNGLYIVEEEILQVEDQNVPGLATLPVITEFGGTPVTNSMYWIKDWEKGYTQVGASGSPIYDQWGLLKGTLTAGQSTVDSPVNDFYSRVDMMYDLFPEQSLQGWIDPEERRERWLPGRTPEMKRFRTANEAFSQEEVLEATHVTEIFELDSSLMLYGFYLPMYQGIDLDTVEISIHEGGEEVFSLSIRSEALLDRLENYVDLLIPIELHGDFEVTVESGRPMGYVMASSSGKQVVVEDDLVQEKTLLFDFLVGGSCPEQVVVDGDEVKYYPNPIEDNFWIEGKVAPESLIFLTSRGQKVYPEYTYDNRGRLLFNFTLLPRGVYFLIHENETITLFHR